MLKKFIFKEPVGFLALTISLLGTIIPAANHWIDQKFYFANNFNVSCPSIGTKPDTYENGYLVYNTPCIFSNNDEISHSIVGVKSVLFQSDRLEYPIGPEFTTDAVLPKYVRPSESLPITIRFRIPLLEPFKNYRENREKCGTAADISTDKPEALAFCELGSGADSAVVRVWDPRRYFYKNGVGYRFGTANRTGAIFSLGVGTNIHYTPNVTKYGMGFGPNDSDRSIIDDFGEDYYTSKKLFYPNRSSSLTKFQRTVIGYIFLLVYSLIIIFLTRFIWIFLKDIFRKFFRKRQEEVQLDLFDR
ncbi:hypothetical protein R2A130_2743 [Ahrensia sp. R2A130]|nr:hypothetical protein R2A130_2743 [Ahrensia sp. R2A130]